MQKPRSLLAVAVLILVGVALWFVIDGQSGTDSGLPSGDRGDASAVIDADAAGKTGIDASEAATQRRIENDAIKSRGGVIRGRVVRGDRAVGVAGVDVLALSSHPAFAMFEARIEDFLKEGFWKPRPLPEVQVLAQTKTEADGSFEITGLGEGRVFLDARSPSWFTRSSPAVRLLRGETREGIELLLAPGGRVRGKVLDSRGKPVAGSRVVLRPSATSLLAQLTSRRFRWSERKSEEDGSFDFSGVPPGEGYALSAVGGGIALAQARQVAVVRGRETVVTLRAMPSATIRGVVRTPDGEVATGAYVGFAYMDLARVLFSVGEDNPARADDQGRFEIQHVAPGAIAVSALQTDLALAPVKRITVVAGGSYDVELTLSLGAELRGRVLDGAGKPVVGARVTARTLEQPRGFDLALVTKLIRYEDTTDADGGFVLRGLVSNRVFLEATHPGFLPASKVWREGREDRKAIELRMSTGAYISGRVVDKKGAPVTRFRVRGKKPRDRRFRVGPRWGRPQQNENPYNGGSPWARARRGETEVQDDDGRFRVGPFPVGKLEVTVDAEGYVESARRTIEIAADKDQSGLEFTLAKGSILRGRVLAAGTPVAEAQVTWRKKRERSRGPSFLPFRITAEPEDLDWMALDSTFGSRSVITNARGEFELRGVASGKVRVTARHPLYAKGALEDLLVEDESERNDLVVEITAGGKIEGRVTGLDRRPVHGAMIVAFSIANGVVKSGVTDKSGEYLLEGLAPGPYVVFKTKLDAALDQVFAQMLGNIRLKSTTVREGRTSRVDIEDRQEGGIDVFGRVTLAGKPVPRAVVTLLGQDRGGPLGIGVRTATADDEGKYEIASVMPGSYLCQITRHGNFRPEVSSQPLRVDGRQQRVRVDLEFPSGLLAGIVVDDKNQPVDQVRLRAVAQDAERPGGLIGMMSEFGGTSRARSDRNGLFKIKRLAPGRYTVRAEPRGKAAELFGRAELSDVTLGAAQELDTLRIVLPRAAVLRGVVVGGSGQPVSGASVRAVLESEAREANAQGQGKGREATSSGNASALRALARQMRFRARSDAKGKFAIRGLAPGRYRVYAEKRGLIADDSQLVDVAIASQGPELRLRLVRSGRVYVKAIDVDGSAIARGRLRVLDSKGRQVGKSKSLMAVMASIFAGKSKDGDGSWMDMGELRPDTYTLEVTQVLKDGKQRVRKTTRKLAEGETARWEVRLRELVKDDR